MKNKIFVLIGLTILFSCFFTIKSYANTFVPNDFSNVIYGTVYVNNETLTVVLYGANLSLFKYLSTALVTLLPTLVAL